MYRDDTGYIEDPENLKTGGWDIVKADNFAFVEKIQNHEIAGQFMDTDSNTWKNMTRLRDKNAAGTIDALYLDTEATSIYFVKANIKVDEDMYDEYVKSKDADPRTFMPGTSYFTVVITTINDDRVVSSLPGGDYVSMSKMGLNIPEDEMNSWLEREKDIQDTWK